MSHDLALNTFGHGILASSPGKHRLATGREKSSFGECLTSVKQSSDQCQIAGEPSLFYLQGAACCGGHTTWIRRLIAGRPPQMQEDMNHSPRLTGSLRNSSPGCKHGLLDWLQLQLHHSPLSSYFCYFLEAWILWWLSWVSWEPDSFQPQAMC